MTENVVIGDATLYWGDCREVLPGLPKHDLLLTDPPYGIGESSQRNKSRVGLAKPIDYGEYSWDESVPDKDTLHAIVSGASNAIIWGGNFFGFQASSKWLVWDKLNSGDFSDCELAWTNLPGSVRIFRHMWNGMLRDSERNTHRVHPTQKPIALMAWCLDMHPKAQTILDPFMGSGTTGVACAKLGKQFTGIERERKYFDIAVERIASAQAQGRLLLPDPASAPVQGGLDIA